MEKGVRNDSFNFWWWSRSSSGYRNFLISVFYFFLPSFFPPNTSSLLYSQRCCNSVWKWGGWTGLGMSTWEGQHRSDKVRETRLRWFGHVQRKDSEYMGRRMQKMERPGRRQRGDSWMWWERGRWGGGHFGSSCYVKLKVEEDRNTTLPGKDAKDATCWNKSVVSL